MPKQQNERIKLISKFLDKSQVPNFEKLNSIDDIISLPISSFNFLNEADATLISELFQINSIGQLNSLDPIQPFEILYEDKKNKKKIEHLLQTDLEIKDKLIKAVTISNIISKIKEESISYLKKEQKVIVVGLGNAGKTTILKKFGGQIGIKDLARLKPTKGAERQEIVTSDLILIIWDFGGQEEYRDMYLQEPHRYFLNIDLVIYVIDLQTPGNYTESIEYFKNILEILEKLEENPHILIFLHKYDPDLKDDPDVLLNVEFVKSLIKKAFIDRKKFEYEIYLSSIYSILAREPKFSRYLKETMEKTATLSDHKLEGMSSVLESTLDGIIRLSETVMHQFSEIERRLINIENTKLNSNIIQSQLPLPEYSSPSNLTPPSRSKTSRSVSRRGSEKARGAVLKELKELIEKRSR
ncbi:MAG: 50S ribosome-binding GTPase [Candidatus Lokiarchaeota archaeon]|nr:50S ribosome-binding GTPase [Candidatus Lokiarchaeota archaeon]